MKEDVYSLPEGDVVLQWPARLSQANFEEIEDWTRLMLRKLKRKVSAGPSPAERLPAEAEEDDEGKWHRAPRIARQASRSPIFN